MSDQTPTSSACANCGKPLRAGASFCALCGARVAVSESETGSRDESTAPGPHSSSVISEHLRELRVVAWLYGLMLFVSLCLGLAYRIDAEGDFEPWVTLALALVVTGFAATHANDLREQLRPSLVDGAAWIKLLLAAIVQAAIVLPIFYLMGQAGIPFERSTDELLSHGYSTWQLFVFISLAPAFFEEIAFRGIIQERLRKVLGDREGWLVQAALFSVLHLSPVIFLTHFVMGLVFGWLRMRTSSLIPGMILHAAWNAGVVVLELRERAANPLID